MEPNNTPGPGRPVKVETPLDEFEGGTVFDKADPRSVINLVPEKLADVMSMIEARYSHWFEKPESEFRKICEPCPMVSRLRLSFWDEYNRAQDKHQKMQLANVIRGVCSKDHFYKHVLTSDKRVAWIISPPKDYFLAMREMLDVGLDEMRDILTMPNVDAKGHPNVRLIAEKLKLIQMLDLRVKGAIMQKMQIQQQNLNLNVDASEQVPEHLKTMSLEQLEALERKIQGILPEASDLIGAGLNQNTIIDGRVQNGMLNLPEGVTINVGAKDGE